VVAAWQNRLKKKRKKPIDLLRDLYKALVLEVEYIADIPYWTTACLCAFFTRA
jgi:hypothetical protein